MAGFELTMKLVKAGTAPLLNSKLLEDKVKKANVKNLYRAAGLVRKIARQSIRRTKKKSQPGQPPRAHAKHPGIKLISFAVDSQAESAVVGTLRFPSALGVDTPHTLEYGGRMRLKRVPKKAKKKPTNVFVKPRPYMGPAHESAQKKYVEYWKDCI